MLRQNPKILDKNWIKRNRATLRTTRYGKEEEEW